MRGIINIALMVVLCTTVNAQVLWERQPISLDYVVKGMYYDEALNVSYIFGGFQEFEGDSTNIGIYDGTDYYSMPKGPVHNIWDVQVYKGKLYAAGGGLSSVAVWDGLAWETISHDDGLVFNLKVIDDKLYVMGNFNSMAGIPASSIAVYNDTSWTGLLGTDTVIGSSWAITDIEFYKGNVYVCGNFTNWGEPELNSIMMHDGESWKPVGDFRIDGLGGLNRMLVWRDTLYVAGMMIEASGSPGNCIAAWDGTNWHRLQHGINTWSGRSGGSIIRDMKVYDNELWVCGNFNVINGRYVHERYGGVAKWNGMEWCTMDLRRSGTIIKLGTWQEELFITGEFILEDDWEAKRVVKWVGGDYTDTCTQNITSGVDIISNEISNLQLFPNPSTDIINVSFSTTLPFYERKVKLEIIDMHGRVLLQEYQDLRPGFNLYTLDVAFLATGNFIIRISGESSSVSSKFNKI